MQSVDFWSDFFMFLSFVHAVCVAPIWLAETQASSPVWALGLVLCLASWTLALCRHRLIFSSRPKQIAIWSLEFALCRAPTSANCSHVGLPSVISVSLIQWGRLAILGPCFLCCDVESESWQKGWAIKRSPHVFVLSQGSQCYVAYYSLSENVFVFVFFLYVLSTFLVVSSKRTSLLLVIHYGQPYFSCWIFFTGYDLYTVKFTFLMYIVGTLLDIAQLVTTTIIMVENSFLTWKYFPTPPHAPSSHLSLCSSCQYSFAFSVILKLYST